MSEQNKIIQTRISESESFDHLLEQQMEQLAEEEQTNQAEGCQSFQRGFENDYVPTYLR